MDDYSLLSNNPSPAATAFLKEFLSFSNKNSNANSSTVVLLTKASTINSIQERTVNGSVPDSILDSLQNIERLDRQQGLSVSDSMRAAFCAVAVHCTLSSLPLSWTCYFDAVQRIWRVRIQNLEDSGISQLLSPDILKWRDDIEAALWDEKASESLLKINTQDEALRRLRVYLREVRSSMKPAFLRLAVTSSTGPKVAPVSPAQASPHMIGDECCKRDASVPAPSVNHPIKPAQAKEGSQGSKALESDGIAEAPAGVCIDKGKGVLRENSQPRLKLGSSRRRRRGAVIIDDLEEDQPTCSEYSFPSTPEVEKLRDALKSSTADLLAAVTDPLPEALEVAERVAAYMVGKNLHSKDIVEDGNKSKGVPAKLVDPAEEPAQTKRDAAGVAEENQGNQAPLNQNNVLRPSLMERNGTARTYEWEDSIDVSAESSRRCRLPSPKIKHVSPLKEHVTRKWVRRRKINRWSIEEEKALMEAEAQ
ncbi:hypothetical protein DITRI_Ditri19aG0004500 [Diplodiscus trichospermus]